MKYTAIKNEILEEIPIWLETDPVFRTTLLRMLKDEFLPKRETESRFDHLMAELRQDREASDKKFWTNHKQIQDMMAEQRQRWDEQDKRWDEQNKKWDEQNKKWGESLKEFERVHEEIMVMSKKIDRTVGGLGARWGMQSERAFRNALAGILEESFDVKVINENVYDTTGEVFGRPDQVEIDVIIHNGLIIACEIKSSLDRADIYVFERKVRFYEKLHNKPVTRMLAISPMISPKAYKVAQDLGVETYSDSIDVKSLHSSAYEPE